MSLSLNIESNGPLQWPTTWEKAWAEPEQRPTFLTERMKHANRRLIETKVVELRWWTLEGLETTMFLHTFKFYNDWQLKIPCKAQHLNPLMIWNANNVSFWVSGVAHCELVHPKKFGKCGVACQRHPQPTDGDWKQIAWNWCSVPNCQFSSDASWSRTCRKRILLSASIRHIRRRIQIDTWTMLYYRPPVLPVCIFSY